MRDRTGAACGPERRQVRKYASDQILRSDVIGSDVIGIDGMGIVVALRLFRVPVKERVAGIDLCWEVLTVCARDGFRPFLLGATPDVLHRAAGYCRSFPVDTFAGLRDGYFRPDQERGSSSRLPIAKPLPVHCDADTAQGTLPPLTGTAWMPFIMGVGGH
jgi:N-acetylglucosaminyldiphosphoundecaprenol N-acetyl-beta-D-mannosaminyltransferase